MSVCLRVGTLSSTFALPTLLSKTEIEANISNKSQLDFSGDCCPFFIVIPLKQGNARVYWLCPNDTVMPAGNGQSAPQTSQECAIWSDVNSGFPGIALGVDVSFRNDNSVRYCQAFLFA